MFIQYVFNYILEKIIKNMPLNSNLISLWFSCCSAFRALLNCKSTKYIEDKDLFAQRPAGLTF